MAADTKELVLRYFESWQEPADWKAFAESLAPDVVFDPGGGVEIRGRDALSSMLESTESPWRDVTLLESIFASDSAALFYEGTERRTGIRHRVGEHVAVGPEGITKVVAVILAMPTEGDPPTS